MHNHKRQFSLIELPTIFTEIESASVRNNLRRERWSRFASLGSHNTASYKIQYDFAERRSIFLDSEGTTRALELTVINVDRRRGSRRGASGSPGRFVFVLRCVHSRRISRSPVINLCRTIQRQRCITGPTAQVQRPYSSRGYLDQSSAQVRAPRTSLPPSRARPLVFWLAISIRLTLRRDPARLTAERLN